MAEKFPTQYSPQGKMINLSKYLIIDTCYSPDCHYPIHVDCLPRISIVLSGKLKETVKHQEEYASAASIVYKPKGVEHSNRFGPQGARLISLAFLDDTLLRESKNTIDGNWEWFHGFRYAPLAYQFLYQLWLEQSIDSVEESAFDLIANLELSNASTIPSSLPPWLARVEKRIKDEFSCNIRLKDLAFEAGIHPVYLARVFRQYYGQSVKGYLQDLRIRHALDILSGSQTSIVQVALDSGFADQSHLNRVFKSRIGLSPGQYKKLVQGLSV